MAEGADDVAVALAASLAAAERELARRRARALASATGREVSLQWHEPRESVAMLARHGDAAATAVTAALARVEPGAWRARFPALDGVADEALRAVWRRWRKELDAMGRGEAVAMTSAPAATEEPAPEVMVPPRGEAPPSPDVGDEPQDVGRARTRRTLSPDAVAVALARHAERVWAESPRTTTRTAGGDEPAVTDARSWFEVAPRGDGALAVYLVVEPVEGFASFVKVLTATSSAWRQGLRRENLARLGARLEVPPACSRLAWTTGDPDDDGPYAPLLASMAPAPFADDAPTVFRTDVTGRTQRIVGTSLAAGARYAVLLPPQLLAPTDATMHALGEGWRLWVLDVPAVPDDALAAALAALGLSLGSAALDATWVVTPPRRWEVTPRGDRLPVFAVGDHPFVRVTSGVVRGDMVAFLWGPGGLERLPLATTERTDVALDALAAGRYVVEVTCADRSVAPARLAFVVDDDARGAWPTATPAVTLGAQTLAPGEGCEADLSSLGEGQPWSVTAPPAMPVRVRWTSHTAWDSGWCSADADGAVDLTAATLRTRTLRESAVLGALSVDFGEWGEVRIAHARTAALAVASARRGLRDAMDAAVALLGAGLADPSLAASLWGRPVAAALGYHARELPDGARRACAGLSVLLVEGIEPLERAFRTRPAALLALLHPSLGLRAREPGTPRATLDAIGAAVGLTRALVSDGRRWWALDLTRSAPPPPDALDAVIDDDEAFEGFLVRYGAWR
ncbi:MAG: hypothetical protein U0324_37140 [Polyangiales bacterium]